MHSYQPLKADEVKFVLVTLRERLENCPRGEREPVFILDCLQETLDELAQNYAEEEQVFRDPDFGMEGINRLGVILSSLSLIEEEYLPAVMHQTEEERKLRLIFLEVAKRLGLTWIKDIVVHSSGILAIFPVFLLNVLEIPVMHVQANFLDKCLCLPGAFHELGHSVFLRFSDFLDAMQREIDAHFDALRRGIGPLPEDQKERELKALDGAQEYWDDDRLAELFSDLFAQYVSGCANMISIIDLSMAEGRPACNTDIEGYPPDAARVKVCEYALTPAQAASEEVKDLLAGWEEYAEVDKNADSFFKAACSEKLLRRFTAVTLELLAKLMPDTPRNVSALPKIDTILGPYETVTFEEVTQRAVVVLMQRPDIYDSWWREARDKIV